MHVCCDGLISLFPSIFVLGKSVNRLNIISHICLNGASQTYSSISYLSRNNLFILWSYRKE